MFDWQIDCRLYGVGLCLPLFIGENRKVDLDHIIYIWTLTILYYRYNVFEQNDDRSTKDTEMRGWIVMAGCYSF